MFYSFTEKMLTDLSEYSSPNQTTLGKYQPELEREIWLFLIKI